MTETPPKIIRESIINALFFLSNNLTRYKNNKHTIAEIWNIAAQIT